MALFVYIAPDCDQEAAKYSLTDALHRTRDQIEKDQDTRLLSPFRYPYFVKKQLGGRQGRLITVLKSVEVEGEKHGVLIFLAVVLRRDRIYEDLSDDTLRVGEGLVSARVDEEAMLADVRSRLSSHQVVSKQGLLEDESRYLYAVSVQHDDHQDDLVYESIEWFQGMQQHAVKQAITRVFDTLPQVPSCTQEGGVWLGVDKSPGLQMLVRYFPQAGVWFLAAITDRPDDRTSLEGRYGEILYSDENDIPALQQLVLQKSRKVYPALLTADEALWKNVELDTVGNLALSPEESDILSVTRHQAQAFPLFINGRAGSGKSTVLQYLFADYLYFHMRSKGGPVRHPVYFSCSNDLILRARDVVRNLLACSSRYWQDGDRSSLIDSNRQVFEESFAEFRAFLQGLLPDEDRERFAKSLHVDYSRFRNLWMKQFQNIPQAHRRYPPDVCWHVIRSYIKGMSADDDLEPDDYLTIELKQRSVTSETFKEVYERVWTAWYKDYCHVEKLWDDQDLARYLLSENLVKPVFPAIFCDESQDFTRLELEVILRMSLFSDKLVPPHEIRLIPFVFAGDQFQTLNPTGFRWEATKAQFVEKFIFELDPTQQSGNEINYRELTYNFRSAAPIVRFSNVIQALRARLFRLGSLKPQIPWSQEAVSQAGVMFYSADNNPDLWRRLISLKDLVFVVPCLENDEIAYIREHPHLKKFVKVEDDGSTSIPVLSASRAKGLEFNRVVVLGFGEDCPLPLEDILAADADEALRENTVENNLGLQYFLNRLYVAVTRAKQQLLVIDSIKGNERFWTRFHEPFAAMGLATMRGARDVWEPMLGRLEEALPLDMLTASPDDEADILDNAEEFARNGRDNRDSYMLRQAGGLYRRLEQEVEAQLCFADAEFFDENYHKAGKLYEDAGRMDTAFQCYWRAMSWKELLDLGQKQQSFKSRPAYRLAMLFRSGSKAIEDQGVMALNALANAVSTLSMEHPLEREAWQKVLRGIMDGLVKSKKQQDWATLHKALERITAEPPFSPLLHKRQQADIAFRAGDYRAARHLWEAQKDTPPNEYYIAVAETDPFPDNMEALRKVKRIDTLLDLFDGCDKAVLQPQHWNILVEIFAEQGDFGNVRTYLNRATDPSTFVEVRRLSNKTRRHEDIVKLCREGELVLMVRDARWTELLKVITDRHAPPDETVALIIARALARSDAFQALSGKEVDNHKRPIRNELTDFLRRCYLGSKDDKRSTGLYPIPEAFALDIGAAFERGGRYTDSLFFYEYVMRRLPALKEAASLRWIASKEHQARTLERAEERLGKDKVKASTDAEREKLNDEMIPLQRNAQEARKRVTDARREMGLSLAETLDELPVLSGLPLLLRELMTFREAAPAPAPTLPAARDRAQMSPETGEAAEAPVAAAGEGVPEAGPDLPLEPMEPVSDEASRPAAPDIAPPAVPERPTSVVAEPAVAVAETWWPDEKLAPRAEWLIGDYRMVVIRKTRRINIEHTDSGETVSLLHGGTEIQSDWDFQTNDNHPGIVRFTGLDLWLDTSAVAAGVIRIGIARLGLAFQVDIRSGE